MDSRKIGIKNNRLKYWAAGYIIVFICFAALHICFGKRVEDAEDWCDYKLYWELGRDLFQNGRFSLYSLRSTVRGTILPLIYGGMYYAGIHLFASETAGFIFGSSIIYAVLYAVLIPKFIKQMGFKYDFAVAGGILLLSFLFWYGIFLYPLSDVIAFTMIMCACCLLQKQKKVFGKRKNLIYGLGIGICLYCAYNIRSIYMFSAFTIAVYIIVQNRKYIKNLIWTAIGIGCGIIIAAIPQMAVNQYLFGIWSIQNTAASDIIYFQLRSGLEAQRYETYVGVIGKAEGEYPNYGIVFEDLIGTELAAKSGIESFESLKQYFCFCIHYFFDIAGIYIRHLVNALCPCYPELVIQDLGRNKVLLTLTNSIIFYFGGYSFFFAVKFRKAKFMKVLKENIFYIAAILLPCAASIPGAVELRYFYPFYMLVYMFVLLAFRNSVLMKSFIKKWYMHCIGFVVVLMPFWALWGETFAKMRYIVSLYTTW